MSTVHNQEYALARWREDAAKDDPLFYTIQQRHGRPFIWLRVAGNVGWYAPELNATGEVISLRSEALPQLNDNETAKDRAALNYAIKLISPKQRQKIARLFSTQSNVSST